MYTFSIEENLHSDSWDGFSSYEDALEELKRRSKIPWDKEPNVCPCTSWRTCERNYAIVQYRVQNDEWEEIACEWLLDISSKGVKWLKNCPGNFGTFIH